MNQNVLVHTLEDIGQDNAGLQVVVLGDGSAFVTQSSYARYVNMSQQAISKRCKNLEVFKVDDINNLWDDFSGIPVERDLIKTKITFPDGTNRVVVLIPPLIFSQWMLKDIPALGEFIISNGGHSYLRCLAGVDNENYNSPKSQLEVREFTKKIVAEHHKNKQKKKKSYRQINKFVGAKLERDNYLKVLELAKTNKMTITTMLNKIVNDYQE